MVGMTGICVFSLLYIAELSMSKMIVACEILVESLEISWKMSQLGAMRRFIIAWTILFLTHGW